MKKQIKYSIHALAAGVAILGLTACDGDDKASNATNTSGAPSKGNALTLPAAFKDGNRIQYSVPGGGSETFTFNGATTVSFANGAITGQTIPGRASVPYQFSQAGDHASLTFVSASNSDRDIINALNINMRNLSSALRGAVEIYVANRSNENYQALRTAVATVVSGQEISIDGNGDLFFSRSYRFDINLVTGGATLVESGTPVILSSTGFSIDRSFQRRNVWNGGSITYPAPAAVVTPPTPAP